MKNSAIVYICSDTRF